MHHLKGIGITISALFALTACQQSAESTDAATTTPPAPSQTPLEEPQPTNSPGPETLLLESRDLAPGRYAITDREQWAGGYPRLILTLPAGWATSDGVVHKRIDQPGEVTLSAWRVDHVFDDPCHWQASSRSELDLAQHRIHQDLHQAATGSFVRKAPHGGLANQHSRNASQLLSVEVGGVSALKIELSVPPGLDIKNCDLGAVRPWIGWGSTTNASLQHVPGQTDVVYMIDVDRAALVVDASYTPQTTEWDLTELQAILASMKVDDGP